MVLYDGLCSLESFTLRSSNSSLFLNSSLLPSSQCSSPLSHPLSLSLLCRPTLTPTLFTSGTTAAGAAETAPARRIQRLGGGARSSYPRREGGKSKSGNSNNNNNNNNNNDNKITCTNMYIYIYVYVYATPRKTHVLHDSTSKNTQCTRSTAVFPLPLLFVLVSVSFSIRKICFQVYAYYHCHCPCHYQYQHHLHYEHCSYYRHYCTGTLTKLLLALLGVVP